jgi:hypothetical protein
METTLHELAHAMVFSAGASGLFRYFRKTDGTFSGGGIGLTDVVDGAVSIRGLATDVMVTPKVSEWVADHYDCPDALVTNSGAKAGA